MCRRKGELGGNISVNRGEKRIACRVVDVRWYRLNSVGGNAASILLHGKSASLINNLLIQSCQPRPEPGHNRDCSGIILVLIAAIASNGLDMTVGTLVGARSRCC